MSKRPNCTPFRTARKEFPRRSPVQGKALRCLNALEDLKVFGSGPLARKGLWHKPFGFNNLRVVPLSLQAQVKT